MPESYNRGRQYYLDGAVGEVARRGAEISAHVEGSDVDPYRVRIRLNDGGVADARCTCPYDWGGYCKHIVAVLMKLAEHPELVIERAPIAELAGKARQVARRCDALVAEPRMEWSHAGENASLIAAERSLFRLPQSLFCR